MKFIQPVLALLLMAPPALALEYPCPSDPGFCYRDIGNDGCFDSGVDEGPIDDEIEGSSSFPPVPPPGSIVCPPSVRLLTASDGSIVLETGPGSSILLYAAKVKTKEGSFEIRSGGDLLLGGSITTRGLGPITARDDVVLEKGISLTVPPDSIFHIVLHVESATGDVTIGPKATYRARQATFLAAGDVTFGDGVRVRAVNPGVGGDQDIRVAAGGKVEMTRPKLISANRFTGSDADISILGAEVRLVGKATIKGLAQFGPKKLEIIATAGDVTADRLSITSNLGVEISGTSISIGSAINGQTPRSRITEVLRHVDLIATDAIQIDNLRLTGTQDVTIATTGTTVDILESSFRGRKATPTITISAGPGSTCDLTGTVVKKATLVTNCDTVVGP